MTFERKEISNVSSGSLFKKALAFFSRTKPTLQKEKAPSDSPYTHFIHHKLLSDEEWKETLHAQGGYKNFQHQLNEIVTNSVKLKENQGELLIDIGHYLHLNIPHFQVDELLLVIKLLKFITSADIHRPSLSTLHQSKIAELSLHYKYKQQPLKPSAKT